MQQMGWLVQVTIKYLPVHVKCLLLPGLLSSSVVRALTTQVLVPVPFLYLSINHMYTQT